MLKAGMLAAVAALIMAATAGSETQLAERNAPDAVAASQLAKRGPSQATIARKLAAAVYSARTPTARYGALVAVMRALNVPVVAATGKMVVRGAPNRQGFYLYAHELELAAHGIGTRRLWSLDNVAAVLQAAQITRRSGRAFQAEDLRQAMLVTTRKARSRVRKRISLLPLLIRELGLRHKAKYDLGRPTPLDRVRLDALQKTMLLADLVLPAMPTGRVEAHHAPTESNAKPRPCAGGSRSPGIQTPDRLWIGGTYDDDIVTRGQGNEVDPYFRAMLLDDSFVLVDRTEIGTETHYGSPGHARDAGKPIRFVVEAVVLYQLSPRRANCGWLGRVRLPPEGPVEGARISWDQDQTGDANIADHGTLGEQRTTNAQGIAAATFTPKDEVVPGFGSERQVSGFLHPRLDVTTVFRDLPAPVAEGLQLIYDAGAQEFEKGYEPPEKNAFGGSRPSLAWGVRFHKPRGFKFSGVLPKWTSRGFDREDGHLVDITVVEQDWSARVCGVDPFAKLWDFTVHHKSQVVFSPGGGGPLVEDVSVQPGGLIVARPGQAPSFPAGGGWVQYELLDSPARVRYRFVLEDGPYHDWEPNEITGTVPVEEDTSCPEPP